MGKGIEHSPEYYPWTRPDMLPHAIASAGWGERYPAIRYDLEKSRDPIIPQQVITQTLGQERFGVVVWQGLRVSFIDLRHFPERTFANEDPGRSDAEWVTLRKYFKTPDGPVFTTMEENLDPREVMPSVHIVLATPMGMAPGQQSIIDAHVPIDRVLIEFPEYREERELPLNFVIGLLGGIASQEYLNTIYGPPEV